jgi:hypothetical protein
MKLKKNINLKNLSKQKKKKNSSKKNGDKIWYVNIIKEDEIVKKFNFKNHPW